MLASEVLRKEHEPMRRMLRVLDVLAKRTEGGDEVPVETYRELIDFIRSYTEVCHIGGKEDRLLATLQACGVMGAGGPVGVMLADHEVSRSLVKGLADAVERYAKGDKSARKEIVRNAQGYVKLLSEHMDKEDNILFPLSDRMIPDSQQQELLQSFGRFEESDVEEDTDRRLHLLVLRLEQELGIEA